ncbi:MAG: formyltetrahydrofolate deformylase [Cytophagales bacterium]|nr:formyltetrahydrofolate deformylase [Cytophagales bacterium]
MSANNSDQAILLIHCPDKIGLITVITQFIGQNAGNIVDLDEHVDAHNEMFFCRICWELEGFLIPREAIGRAFEESIGSKYQMTWKLHFSDQVPKMALMVSKSTHCLYDILSRQISPDWEFEISCIISNHRSSEHIAQQFGIPFHHFEVNRSNKEEVEEQQKTLFDQYEVDFVVLARYMQILSADFIKKYPNQIINIHHSFLPAFPGAKPYHQAFERGVKIIGATSHYVTEDLDAGPIIEQDVVKISHKDSVADLIRKGQDLEKIVLSRAIWAHINRKVLCLDNKTVVFD